VHPAEASVHRVGHDEHVAGAVLRPGDLIGDALGLQQRRHLQSVDRATGPPTDAVHDLIQRIAPRGGPLPGRGGIGAGRRHSGFVRNVSGGRG
jgi:hypothetical protein